MTEQEDRAMTQNKVVNDFRSISSALFKAQKQLAATRLEKQHADDEAKRANDSLNDIVLDERLALLPNLGQLEDPTTGRSNKDYTEQVLDQRLRENERVTQAAEAAQKANTRAQELGAQLKNDLDYFSAVRSVARMFSATVEYVGEQESLMPEELFNV